jgi:hypothetical protein
MPILEFTMDDLEVSVFENIALDPQEWIENAIRHQIEVAKDEIVEIEKARMLNDPACKFIPSSREEICSRANLTSAASRLS